MIRNLMLFIFAVSCLALHANAQSATPAKAFRIPERNCQVLKTKLTNFIDELRKTPDAHGHIIVYEGNQEYEAVDRSGRKSIRQILPRVGEINYQIKGIEELLRSLNAPVEKFKIVPGGFRRKFAVEFWNVPSGAQPPKPTPNLKKMQYRNGTVPTEYPYWDC